jgi:putative MATE family efflux protein
MMGTTSECLDLATLYLRIYFSGMVFNMLYNFGASILRSAGETKKPLYYLTIAGVANVILNLILVIGFKMDVAGVALGTILSQAISGILIILCLMKRKDSVKFEFKKLRIDWSCLGEMVLIGLPAGIQGSLFSISNVFIQSAVNSFDSALIVGGNTAASNIEGFVWTSMNGFYQACITFSSRNFGAGKIKNCKKVLFYCLLCVIATGVILGGLGLLFSEQLLSIYLDNVEAIEIGKNRMAIIMMTYFIGGVMDVLVGGLRGLGYSMVPMIVSILGVCGFRLVWIFTIFELHHSLDILYISYPISWLVTSLFHGMCYFIVYKIVRRRFVNRENLV